MSSVEGHADTRDDVPVRTPFHYGALAKAEMTRHLSGTPSSFDEQYRVPAYFLYSGDSLSTPYAPIVSHGRCQASEPLG